MVIRRFLAFYCFMCFVLLACQAQDKKVDMDKLIKAELALTEKYEHQPLFGAQLNKTGCKMILEIEGGEDYRLTDSTGESMMLPLNYMLLKKGKQRLLVKIYPRDGEEFLTMHATASITVYRAAGKNSEMGDYKKLVEFELPADIGSQKLPYYEASLAFEADVPYDYQKELDRASDLTEIPDIEKKVVNKYKELRVMGMNCDENAYSFDVIHKSAITSNTLYLDTYDEIKKSYDVKRAVIDCDPAISDREFLPIENYAMQFYANGKLVALWQKNHLPMFYLKAIIHKGTDKERKFEGGDPILLYMPEGSKELKVW